MSHSDFLNGAGQWTTSSAGRSFTLAPSFRTAVRTCVQLSGLGTGRLSCEESNPRQHDGRTKRSLAAVASRAVTRVLFSKRRGTPLLWTTSDGFTYRLRSSTGRPKLRVGTCQSSIHAHATRFPYTTVFRLDNKN